MAHGCYWLDTPRSAIGRCSLGESETAADRQSAPECVNSPEQSQHTGLSQPSNPARIINPLNSAESRYQVVPSAMG
jgi:hypothetical protein